MVIEMIQMSGQDVTYVPREDFVVDDVLQEPKATQFRRTYLIEAYNASGHQYDGEQNIMSKFGFRVNQTTELIISKKRFAELGTSRTRPMEGDLIYIGDAFNPENSLTNSLFEITQVWYDSPDWQFGKNFVYKISLETFTVSRERFKTGKPALDTFDDISDEQEAKSSINQSSIAKTSDTISQAFDRQNPFAGF